MFSTMIYRRKQIAFATAAMLSLNPLALFAEDDELDLGELFNLQMTSSVASKKEQRVQDAPGIITVYRNQDIHKYGYNTIADLADITAGYSSNSRFNEKGLETRGQGVDPFNNQRHLLLVDGIPVRHARANKAPIDENMPLFYADRVEFLKGPASALYGVGAFYGVINVVPVVAKDTTRAYAKLYAGNIQQKTGAQAYISTSNKNFEGYTAVNYYKQLASNEPLAVAPKNLSPRGMQDDKQDLFINSAYTLQTSWAKGLKLGFLYSTQSSGFGENYGVNATPYDNLIFSSIMPYAKYVKQISEGLSVNSYLAFTESDEKSLGIGDPYGVKSNASEYSAIVRSFDGVLEGTYDFNDHLSLITGFNFYQNKAMGGDAGTYKWVLSNKDALTTTVTTDSAFSAEKDPSRTYSGYAQLSAEIPVLEGLLVTAGLRNDYGTFKDHRFSQLSPRIALVQKIIEPINVKVMYGTALRAPGTKEFSLNDEKNAVIDAQKLTIPKFGDLDAEVIHSFEGGVTFNNDKVSASVSGFYNITKDPLVTASNGFASDGKTTVAAFKNSQNSITAYGVEIDAQAIVYKGIKVLGNYAYAEALDTLDWHPSTVPAHKVNAGVTVENNKFIPVEFTVLNKWISAYRADSGDVKIAPVVDRKWEGNNTVDTYLQVGITKHLGLNLQVRNLFDETGFIPAANYSVKPLLPRTGREFLGGVSLNF